MTSSCIIFLGRMASRPFLALCLMTFLLALGHRPAAAMPSLVSTRIVVMNNGTYPITIDSPSHVDGYDYAYGSVPVIYTENGAASGPVTISGYGTAVLVFDVWSDKSWGFNLGFCQQDGPCDNARIEGSGGSVAWTQSNSFSLSSIQPYDRDIMAGLPDIVKKINEVMGVVSHIPVVGGIIGGPLIQSSSHMINLKQKCNARFFMDVDISQVPQIQLKVHRVLPNGATDFSEFIVDDDKVVTGSIRLAENTCRVGNTQDCVVTLAGTESSLNYAGSVGMTNRAGCSRFETLGYSSGAFVIRNRSHSPLRYTVFINKRMVTNDEVMPRQDSDLRATIGRIMTTVGERECPQVQDAYMGGRLMGVCPFRLDFANDDAKGSLNCTLSMRQGTVQSATDDKLNLYSLTTCKPSLPAIVGNGVQLRMDRYLMISGMYKMIALNFLQ